MSDQKIYKIFNVESRAIDPEAGIYEAMISTEDVDRDGDVMVAAGAQTVNYLKNPIVLVGHNYRDPQAVVGKTLEMEIITGRGIRARWQFAGKEVNENADLVRRLWAGGFLNATSIGFIPKKSEPRTTDEGEPLRTGRKFTEWELLEYSIISVPANQNALRLAIKMFGEEGEAELKPFPNEHACRLRDPGAFQSDSFRRVRREHEGKTYFIIMGRLTGESTMTEQSYRYPKDSWSVAQARAHCKAHDGASFEPAEGTRTINDECDGCEPDTELHDDEEPITNVPLHDASKTLSTEAIEKLLNAINLLKETLQ
jgi:HK97 family phage prohead protease